MPEPTLGDLFLELARPDDDGFSRRVPVSEFADRYARLRMGNGGGWCRDDGPLARRFNILRHKDRGRIVAVELQGRKKQPIEKPVPAHIRQRITSEPCAVLAVGNVECDHKDGRRDDPRLTDASRVAPDDFQPLSKAANNAKRQHCRRCRETGLRFDARRLGYRISQFKGTGVYNGSRVGCYWHDPRRFNHEASGGDGADRGEAGGPAAAADP